jgi:transcriptional regulator with XRE-family HTH domain
MPKSLHSSRHLLIAGAIKQQRQAVGLTQMFVAKSLGRHQSFIANIESGQRRVDLVELLDIASVIGLDVPKLARKLKRSS